MHLRLSEIRTAKADWSRSFAAAIMDHLADTVRIFVMSRLTLQPGSALRENGITRPHEQETAAELIYLARVLR